MKTFYFLAGLPRSGATLLTSILNQNPEIYVSPQTDLLQQLSLLENAKNDSEAHQAGLLHQGYKDVLQQHAQTFYKHRPENIIIDKNRSWGMFLNQANYITPNIKILAPIRPIEEILASFIRQCNVNPYFNYIDKNLIGLGLLNKYDSLNDARCAWLLDSVNELSLNILSTQQAYTTEHAHKFYIFQYSDLINDTNKIISKIYEFLNLPYYEHNLKNIIYNEKPQDEKVFGLKDLHKVRSKIKQEHYNIDEYVSPFIKKKYSYILNSLTKEGDNDRTKRYSSPWLV